MTPRTSICERPAGAAFLFAGESGTISGWSPAVDATHAITMYDDPDGAVFKGLAIADNGADNLLYATDFHNNKRAVFDRTFASIDVPGGFMDAALPDGYAPFGIQALQIEAETRIVVTYAKQDLVANVISLEPTGHITRRACMERRRLCQVCSAARLQNAHHCKRLSGSRLPR